MTTLKSLLALSFVAALAGSAHAASYDISGTQAYRLEGITDPVASGGLGATLISTPTPPTFTDGGTAWVIDPNTLTLAGAFHFADYHVAIDIASLSAAIDVDYHNRILTLGQGSDYSVSYDAAGRALTATGVVFIESSDTTCSDNAAGAYCSFVPGLSVPTTGDLVITYDDATFTTFTGVAHTYQLALDNGSAPCIAQGGGNACADGALTFSGTSVSSVPVPAAAWLFGSSMLGLVGMSRRNAKGV